MKVIKDLRYVTEEYTTEKPNGQPLLDLYLPDDPVPGTPVVVWFHGGGFVNDSKEGDPGAIAAELANAGIVCANANYRLYPEAKYPEFIEDGASAIAWCRDNLKHYIPSPGKIFAGGESAGAYLTMMLCFNRSFLLKHGIDPDTDIAGWIHGGGQPTTHFNVLKERGMDSRRVIVDDAAPLYYIDRNTFAPMVLLATDNDIPGRMYQNYLVEATLRHWGFEKEIDLRILKGAHCAFCHKGSDGLFAVAEIMKEFVAKYR